MFPMTDLDLDEEASHYMPEERLESWEQYDEKVMVSTMGWLSSSFFHLYSHFTVCFRNMVKPWLKYQFYSFWNLHCLCTPSTPKQNITTLNTRYENYTLLCNEPYFRSTLLTESKELFKLSLEPGSMLTLVMLCTCNGRLTWITSLRFWNKCHRVCAVSPLMSVLLSTQPTTFNWRRRFTVKLVSTLFWIRLVMEVSLVWLELSVNHFKGLFSERHLEEINECTYDPPYAGKGATPGWAAGSTKQVKQITDGIPTETESYDSDYGYDDGYEYDYRKKRKRRFDMGGIYGGGKSVYQRLCRLFWTVF